MTGSDRHPALQKAALVYASVRRVSIPLAVIATFAVLAILSWTGAATREEMHVASQRAVRVAELRGTITYLDEWLTMSAQVAAATGDRRWADRFEEAVPKLDAAIAEAAELAPAEIRAQLVSTTAEAHRDLLTMERRALALAADGDLRSARDLLGGPEFGYLKDVYATGQEVFGQELTKAAGSHADDINNRVWMGTAALALTAAIVTLVIALGGRIRVRGALARAATMARTDFLTELPNRRQFYIDLRATLARAGASAAPCSLLILDLDRFKAANDGYGHPAGDRLLQLVATRLLAAVRFGDIVARLGGDEFGIIVPHDTEAGSSDTAGALNVADRVVEAMMEPFSLDNGTMVQLGASVGVTHAERGDSDIDLLMQQADLALRRAKADGRGCVRAFDRGIDEEVRSRVLLENDLRRAIADDAIIPYFQPLVAMTTGRLIGVEMLARWPHPTRGMVPPVAFIPLAEDLGLIGALTDRLLRRACIATVHWPDHFTVACNVSPLQLRDVGLPAMIDDILRETGFPAHRLEIEVTESALVGDLPLARALLGQLKALGVRLALDDFGTGYASLKHLHSLPFDKLKIDASFVAAMATDRESGKIVSAVVGLGHSLGLSTVAEGVETEEVASLLRDLGCDVGQGWLYGRPVPAAAIEAMLDDAVLMVA